MDTFTRLIGERIKLAREATGFSQEKLTRVIGFNDRQTLSTIELGQRRVSPEELVQFAQTLSQPLDYFTDPYRVAGAKAFSYRSKGATELQLKEFEAQAGNVIGAQRRFQELLDRPPSPVQAQISSIGERVPLDFAAFQGERCAAAWKLGEIPALRLREAAAKILGVVVLNVDAPKAISGAACRLPDGAYVMINRQEPIARQNFDLGHELFHILTWDKMPPPRVDQIHADGDPSTKRSKVEKLADSFAAGLLMPSSTVQARWLRRGERPAAEWLVETSREFGVSPLALFWRSVHLGLLKAEAENRNLAEELHGEETEARPALFSPDFVRDLHAVLENGLVTVKRVLSLLDMDQQELKDVFASYKLSAPFDL